MKIINLKPEGQKKTLEEICKEGKRLKDWADELESQIGEFIKQLVQMENFGKGSFQQSKKLVQTMARLQKEMDLVDEKMVQLINEMKDQVLSKLEKLKEMKQKERED